MKEQLFLILKTFLTTICLFALETVRVMLPFALIAVLLVTVDLFFGVRAAKFRKDSISFSYALIKSGNKLVSYLCWVSVIAAVDCVTTDGGKYDTLKWFLYASVAIIEGSSTVNNWLEPKGLKVNLRCIRNINRLRC